MLSSVEHRNKFYNLGAWSHVTAHVIFTGLKEVNVNSADEAYKLLTIGQRNLSTACTKLNHSSSRRYLQLSLYPFDYWLNLHAFLLLSADFFFFSKSTFEKRSECQTVWIQIRYGVWLGQTVCKCYLQQGFSYLSEFWARGLLNFGKYHLNHQNWES